MVEKNRDLSLNDLASIADSDLLDHINVGFLTKETVDDEDELFHQLSIDSPLSSLDKLNAGLSNSIWRKPINTLERQDNGYLMAYITVSQKEVNEIFTELNSSKGEPAND